jgi:hypothetical protein
MLIKEENLPNIITKVPSNLKDHQIFEYNMGLSKKYGGGKIPSYLQPIGHSRKQKYNSAKMKDYIENQKYSTIETGGNNKSRATTTTPSKTMRASITVSQFKTAKTEASLLKKGKMSGRNKKNLTQQPGNVSSDNIPTAVNTSNIKAILTHKKI